MPKPGADPSSGISLGDALRLPKRHPACRRREAQSGSCTERENLAGDAKGKAQAATTARLKVPVERRGRVIAVESGQLGQTGRSPTFRRKAAALVRWHEPDDARVSRPESVRGSG